MFISRGYFFMVTKHYSAIESFTSNYENCPGDQQKEGVTFSPSCEGVRHLAGAQRGGGVRPDTAAGPPGAAAPTCGSGPLRPASLPVLSLQS